MKLKDIEIKFSFGMTFVMEQNDWENAPDPICMELINEDTWEHIADELKSCVEENYSSDLSVDGIYDLIWGVYEIIVVKHQTFYYEDMTDEEYDTYKCATDKDAVARTIYERIKSEA